MRHPDEARLALYAGGDLGFFERIRVGGHMRSCAACRSAIDSYRESSKVLRRKCAELPEGLDWDRLAAEMTGNIRVGLAAGECVASARAPERRLSWKPALAVLGVSMVMVSAWWLNFPEPQRDNLARGVQRIWKPELRRAPSVAGAFDPGVYLEVDRAGIQFRENGSAMTLKRPSSVSETVPVVVTVNTQGSMRASYIDADTGQVTINNVIAQ